MIINEKNYLLEVSSETFESNQKIIELLDKLDNSKISTYYSSNPILKFDIVKSHYYIGNRLHSLTPVNYNIKDFFTEKVYPKPEIEDLIKELGNRFLSLNRIENLKWEAVGGIPHTTEIVCVGETALEAMIKLYLEINK